jgi:hypothetical protein
MEHLFFYLIIVQLFYQPNCILTPMSILCIPYFYDITIDNREKLKNIKIDTYGAPVLYLIKVPLF